MTQRHHHTKGSYHSSAATAESLEVDDSLVDLFEPEPLQEADIQVVRLEGMELLPDTSTGSSSSSSSSSSEEEETDAIQHRRARRRHQDSEVDSLVLARTRLCHIWVNRPDQEFCKRGRTRLRFLSTDPLDACHHEHQQRQRWRRRAPPRREEHKTISFDILPELDPIDRPPSNTLEDDDDSSSSYSLGDTTVDSLILTRVRFAAASAARDEKPRPRIEGFDLLFLGRKILPDTKANLCMAAPPVSSPRRFPGKILPDTKANRCMAVPFVPPPRTLPVRRVPRNSPLLGFQGKAIQGQPPLRQHSDGAAKLRRRLLHGKHTVQHSPPTRHHSDGRVRAGRAA